MKTTIQTLLLFVFLSAAAAEENQNYYLNNPIEDLTAGTRNPAREARENQNALAFDRWQRTAHPYSANNVESLREDQNENEQDYTYETKNKYRWAWLLGVVGFLFVIIGTAMRYKK
jgi:hypothetical protein